MFHDILFIVIIHLLVVCGMSLSIVSVVAWNVENRVFNIAELFRIVSHQPLSATLYFSIVWHLDSSLTDSISHCFPVFSDYCRSAVQAHGSGARDTFEPGSKYLNMEWGESARKKLVWKEWRSWASWLPRLIRDIFDLLSRSYVVSLLWVIEAVSFYI